MATGFKRVFGRPIFTVTKRMGDSLFDMPRVSFHQLLGSRQRERGQCVVNNISPQSFIITFSYSLANNFEDFDWLAH